MTVKNFIRLQKGLKISKKVASVALNVTYSVKYLCSDFKKKNGYKRSCELSEIYGLYRQNYCGCIYSKLEADEREKAKNNNEQPLSVQ